MLFLKFTHTNNIFFWKTSSFKCILKQVIPKDYGANQEKWESHWCYGVTAEAHWVYTIPATLKPTYKVNGRQTPQVTPQSATLPCQDTIVVLTSRERMDQDQLTPKYPIKHKGITSVFMKGSQFTPSTALPLARTTCKVCGWMEDWSVGRGP